MGMGNTMHVTTLTQEILQIVEHEIGKQIDQMEMEYAEFVTHLKYLAYRIVKKETVKAQEKDLLRVMSSWYQKEYLISQKIVAYVKIHYDYDISDDAVASLILYIKRIM